MKKKYQLIAFISFFMLIILSSCGSKSATKKENKAEYVKIDSSADTDLAYVDSLKLEQGEIPPGWEKVKLWEDGYYISFPKKPWKKIIHNKNRIEFHYPKKNYDTYASITDLAKEPAYKETKAEKQVFYEAVLKDLLADLTDSDDQHETPQIIKKEEFICLNLYEGMYVELEAMDVHIYTECVIIGKMLYTMSFLIWGEESPAAIQTKDRFFKSFGKELQVK
jgi:hypothetical protein